MRNGPNSDLVLLAIIGLVAFTVTSIALPIMFAIFSHGRWKETELGRSIMFRDIVLSVLLVFTAVGLLGLPRRIMLIVGIVFYWLGTFITIDRMVLMIRAYTNETWPFNHRREKVMPDKKPRPVLLAMSVVVGVDTILGGVALTSFVSKDLIALLVLISAGFKVGVAYYLQGRVVPFEDVAAYVPDRDRQSLIAGPASNIDPDRMVRVTASHGVTDQ